MIRPLVVVLSLLVSTSMFAQWPQWGSNPQHTAQVGVPGQTLDRNIVDIAYDSLINAELQRGGLFAHFQAPLIEGNDVFMMFKTGSYTSQYQTQIWGETKYSWHDEVLTQEWQFTSDWKPPGTTSDFWEPVFHPVLQNNALYVPGAGGSVFKINRLNGVGVRIGNIEPNQYVVSPLVADASGNIYYTVIQSSPTGFYNQDVDSWLVRISSSNVVTRVNFSTITPGAPRANDQCSTQFTNQQLPWPPSPTAVPPSDVCGSQRPGLNAAPAIANDGTIYVVSRAHFNSRSSYLVAVRSDLTPKWIASLRNRLTDGCGVPRVLGGVLPANGTPGGCRVGANLGVDPATNTPGSGRVDDNGSSSPVVAPDGSIIYGANTRYNYAQGHLMHFASDGSYLNAYAFGWDVTPAIYSHDGTYSILTKENRYRVSSYCSDFFACPNDRTENHPEYPEGYWITQLSPTMQVEWQYQNTENRSCARLPDGRIQCVVTNAHGFEWCVNAFVVDLSGVVYANAEDGFTYAIRQGGGLKGRIFQQLALGAAYTPTAIDALGRIYTQNAGHLFVATGGLRRRAAPHR